MYIAGTEADNKIFIITNINDVSQINPSDVKVLMHLPRQAEGRLRTLWVADMDNDGKLSLMIGGERNGRIYDVEYKGSGDPTDSLNWDVTIAFDIFQFSGISPTAPTTLTPRLFYGYPCGDMDGDGYREYAFVNYSSDFNVWPEDAYVFIIENQVTSSVENEMKNGAIYYLGQNYPNPFNPYTHIEFMLIEDGLVNISIYNLLGEKVKTLVNDYRKSGNYKILFDASDLPAGTYLYEMKVNNFRETKKMILLK